MAKYMTVWFWLWWIRREFWYAARSSPESCVVADGDSSNSFMCPSAEPLCLSCPS